MSSTTHKMAQTAFQREAHPILVKAGFAYMRTTGSAHNIYRDKDGNRIGVASTPTNRSGAIESIKNQIRKLQRTEASDVAAMGKTAPLIAEADSFLLKPAATRHAIQARNAALTKWVRRVMEKHGPMDQRLLTDAIGEMGFGLTNVKQARTGAGVIAYVIPGEGQGKGKGQFTTWIGLDHQIPPHATRLGQKRRTMAVRAERDEPKPGGLLDMTPPAHSIGSNNGEGPDPREEAQARIDDPEVGMDDVAPPVLVPEAAPAQQWPEDVPFGPADASNEVTAAAQMLLESLGLKTAHPRMGEGLDSLDEFLADLEWRLGKARESVATLKGLLG